MNVRVYLFAPGSGTYREYEANHFEVAHDGVLTVTQDDLTDVKAVFASGHWAYAEIVDNNSATV